MAHVILARAMIRSNGRNANPLISLPRRLRVKICNLRAFRVQVPTGVIAMIFEAGDNGVDAGGALDRKPSLIVHLVEPVCHKQPTHYAAAVQFIDAPVPLVPQDVAALSQRERPFVHPAFRIESPASPLTCFGDSFRAKQEPADFH